MTSTIKRIGFTPLLEADDELDQTELRELLRDASEVNPHRWDPSEHHEPFHIEWEDA